MKHLTPIAHIHNDFITKFGIPRQSNLVHSVRSRIQFTERFRNPEAFRGLDTFSHLWLIWGFSQTDRDEWSPTVRPPKLGGNTRMGVFATRSPYRPNGLGLSSVEFERIEYHSVFGPVIHVRGADLMNNTPIYDIKPYIPFADSHPDALASFADPAIYPVLTVEFPAHTDLPAEQTEELRRLLEQDPRPSYHDDPARFYGMIYGSMEIQFTVKGDTLTVHEMIRSQGE